MRKRIYIKTITKLDKHSPILRVKVKENATKLFNMNVRL